MILEEISLTSPVIRLEGIYKRFYIGTENELEVLHGISLELREKEFTAIVGESGSGKSTLMNIIGLLDHQTEGRYDLNGTDVSDMSADELARVRNQEIGFVFQTYNLIPRTSALKNVEIPLMYAHVPQRERTERAQELLEMVGMKERMNHRPDELSGG
ncbi:MAG: ATP-binding cassette domain-containing protein, partial [Lachnospiraceae bacterium]|nr:ATP-binding cassette domain-containing protein [Lachnospiraceae bacterium]